MEEAARHWFAVRCVFVGEPATGRSAIFEERITLWRTVSADEALARAETEAQEYAAATTETPTAYTGLAQSYRLFDEPVDGAEVFSLMRESDLGVAAYLDRFFDSGSERQAR